MISECYSNFEEKKVFYEILITKKKGIIETSGWNFKKRYTKENIINKLGKKETKVSLH